MQASRRKLIFICCIFAGGFAFFWLMEPILARVLLSQFSGSGIYLQKFLASKLQHFGTENALQLIPQLKFRWLLLCAFGWWLWTNPDASSPIDENRLRWRVRLFFVIQLLYIPELLGELNIRWQWAGFFDPPLLTGIFIQEMPPLMLLQFCGLFLFGISAWLILTKWKNGSLQAAIAGFIIWILWTFLLGIYQSGGVMDHAYASMHSAMFFMAVFLFIWWKFPEFKEQGHRLFQAGIWSCYFFAGLEKVFLSGFNWLDSGNFSDLCLHHPGKLCDWFASHPVPACMALALVLAFQLLSPLQWRFPGWGYITAVSGLTFHLGTWLVLDVGGWQSPWLVMLLFLLPVIGSSKPAKAASVS